MLAVSLATIGSVCALFMEWSNLKAAGLGEARRAIVPGLSLTHIAPG